MFLQVFILENTLNIFSRTTGLEKLKLTLSDMLQKQICKKHDPRGSGGGTKMESVFTCAYKGKILLKPSQEPMDQKI
jgi:hypothetical protein